MMKQSVNFVCVRCRKPASMQTDGAKRHVPCPHCGAMNQIPEKQLKRRRFPVVALGVVLLPIALVGIFWGLTATLGADSLRPEIAQLTRGRRNAVVIIKTPAPFVLTYTISVSGGEGQASMRIRKYYYWFVTIRREVPENDVPDLIKRVWR